VKYWHTHAITAIVLTILLIISAVNLAGRRNSRREFWIANAIEKQLRSAGFDELKDLEAVQEYIRDTVIDNFFKIKDKGRDQVIINELVIRILATKERGNGNGYYSSYKEHYDSSVDYCKDPWVYKSADDNGIKENLVGYFSKYDGSGCTYEPDSATSTKDDIDTEFKNIKESLRGSLRAIVIGYSYYNKVMDLLVSVNIVLLIFTLISSLNNQ
jgi:hypothetical protein